MRVDVASRKSGDELDRPPAVDDEMLVGIGHAQLRRVDIAEDGPDEGHATAARARPRSTDQPPSILSSCPVTTRDSSDRK